MLPSAGRSIYSHVTQLYMDEHTTTPTTETPEVVTPVIETPAEAPATEATPSA